MRHFVKRHPPRPPGASPRPDRPWRLTGVRHPRGWLRIDWQAGVVARLESDAGSVEFVRRSDGRIVAARDDLGRAVGYGYDEQGRLATATDLAGGTWSYGYGGDGALAAMADPRGKTVLAATHAEGRTATVRALHAETTFHYGTGATRAVDGLGRTTTFHRAADGLTTGVADAAGRLTQVAFDAESRPVSISRDGAVVARMDYDEVGRLTSLWRPDGGSTLGYGDHGLTSVDGAETARYRYEAGRISHAEDAGGERGYAYTDDGLLASATAGGVETTLATRPDGVVDAVWRDGERLLGIDTAPTAAWSRWRAATAASRTRCATATTPGASARRRNTAAGCRPRSATTPPATWSATSWPPAGARCCPRTTRSATTTRWSASAPAKGRTCPTSTTPQAA